MDAKAGRYALIEQLLADDIHTMFGNPGTVEQGFLDVISEYPGFEYILGLQESVSVAMADGFARVTGRPAVVQLHSGVGLGNGIGMLYQALRGHAPLLVLSSEAGLKYNAMEAQMATDLVAMASPVTKWATRVVHPSSLLRVIRRALKTAMTPPTGPVFVALPADVLDAPCDERIVPTSFLQTRVASPAELVARAAEWLGTARRPLIIMGDGVAFSGAQPELTRVAELLGAEVWGADNSEVNISAAHPLYRGNLGHMFGFESSRVTRRADAVLICGTYVFPEVYPALTDVFTEGARVVHIDLAGNEIAKNFPVDLGLQSDPKVTLGQLADALTDKMGPVEREAAAARLQACRDLKQQALSAQIDSDKRAYNDSPMPVSAFAEALAERLPKDSIVFDEALTCSPAILRYLQPSAPKQFFQTRGGSLGIGIPGAMGAALAQPRKTVVCFTGDGASLYTLQALWTAAHHRIGAKFVVCNNRSYRLLKVNILEYWREQGIQPHPFPEMFELRRPEVDFASVARAMGVPAVQLGTPGAIVPTIERMLNTDGPFLIDLLVRDEGGAPNPE